MTRYARVMGVILMAAIALGAALPAAAQDDGVGFADMPGLQQAVTRTWDSASSDPSTGAGDPRELRKPVITLMLTAVYTFDTEANAAAAFELLKTDMNATGMSGQPLSLTPVTLPVSLDHQAASAVDDSGDTRYDFSVAMAIDGTFVYTVIAITTDAPPTSATASMIRMMADGQVGAEPEALDASGGSTGGLWGKVPTREMVERVYRGAGSATDAAPFPA